MEQRLKTDILNDASKYQNRYETLACLPTSDPSLSQHRLLLHDEQGGKLKGSWEEVDADAVKTVREVYEELRAAGYHIVFQRLSHHIPITFLPRV